MGVLSHDSFLSLVLSQPLVFDRGGPRTIGIRSSEIGNPTMFGCIRSGLKRGMVSAPLPLRKELQNRRGVALGPAAGLTKGGFSHHFELACGAPRMAQPGRLSRKHLKILCRQLDLPNGQSHPASWQTSDLSQSICHVFLWLRYCFCNWDALMNSRICGRLCSSSVAYAFLEPRQCLSPNGIVLNGRFLGPDSGEQRT